MTGPRRSLLDSASNVAIIVLALSVSIILVKREFLPSLERHDHEVATLPGPVQIDGWEEWSKAGRWIGDSTAAVRVVVFGDYECPYCAQFDSAFRALRDSVGEAISLLHIHFPLSYHEWALPAAQIAECAAEQSRFEAMHSLLYREQRHPPQNRRPWGQLIREVGNVGEAPFLACMNSPDALERIARGRALGDSLGVSSTPTVAINGFRYQTLPAEHLRAEFEKHYGDKRP